MTLHELIQELEVLGGVYGLDTEVWVEDGITREPDLDYYKALNAVYL